jgi:hypothetical protein
MMLAGCSGGGRDDGASAGSYGFPQVKQDDKAEITVWVDADRSGAVDAFRTANPDVPVKVVSSRPTSACSLPSS